MNNKLKPVMVIQDESSDWFVIPKDLYFEFRKDERNEDLVDSGQFDQKWGGYRTGGDINLVQLYAEVNE